jgi:hypothetical protein
MHKLASYTRRRNQHQTEIIPTLGAINSVVDCFSLYDVSFSVLPPIRLLEDATSSWMSKHSKQCLLIKLR